MTDPTRRRIAWSLWIVTLLAYAMEVALLFATAGLPALGPFEEPAPLIGALEDLAFVAVGTLGLRLVLRQPGNAVGWWIILAGMSFPLEGLGAEFVQFGQDRWGEVGIVVAAGWVVRWIWILATFNIPFLLLLYPDGHVPSRRWRPALWLAVAIVVLAFVTSAFYADTELPSNPLGVPSLTPLFDSLLNLVVFPGQLVLVVLGLLSLVARYLRGEGIERQQVKVLLWVGVVAVAFFASISNVGGPIWLDPVLNFAFTVFVGAALTLAILRYRLYDFDRLVSRALAYALVVGMLAAIYAFVALWLPSRLVGADNELFVAGSTLAVAALFNPLRLRVMRWVDRRFNRSRYDAEQIADEFSSRLRRHLDADELAEELATVVTGSLEPTSVGVWMRESEPRPVR